MAEIILKLMQAASTNSSEIGLYQKFENASSLMESGISSIGGTLAPSVSLLNHSCDPNTIKIFNKGTIILMASRIIKEGEEVLSTYSYNFAEADKKKRQEYLKRKYCFDCQCRACDENWPIKEEVPKNFDDLRQGQLLVDLGNSMGLMQQVTKIQKLGSSISQEQKAGNYKKAFGLCIEFSKVLEDTIGRPHAYYMMSEKSMFKLAWIIYGSISM